MNTVNQKNYNGKTERAILARAMFNDLENMYRLIIEARSNEMSFAPNDTVDPSDFDNLKIKVVELINTVKKLERDNK